VSPANLTSSILVGSPRCDGVLTPIDPSTSIKHGFEIDDEIRRNAMTDTRPFDPALFRDAAIHPDTANLNARQHRIGADADLDLVSPLLGPAGDRHNRVQGVVSHG